MIKNFETIIGIEIHLELNTKTKLFSGAKNDFDSEINDSVSVIDLAYPGTLPSLNKEVVVRAIKLAKALKMKIDKELHFDRKNYFYTDLPKGFQITQYFRPIGSNGFLEIEDARGQIKNIRINRIHIEEDTARQVHKNNETLINYNRAGLPLIEIVTEPDINDEIEAINYISMIAQIAKNLKISNAIMAKGSLRADINISTRLKGLKNLNSKVEIKNLNSLNNIKNSIIKEREKQVYKILKNIEIEEETKRFSEQKNDVITMRKKTSITDYKYFPEPNIPLILLEENFIKEITIEKLPNEIKKELIGLGVDKQYINSIINDCDLYSFINKIKSTNVVEWIKIVFSEFVPLQKEGKLSFGDNHISYETIQEMITYYEKEKINRKQLKKLVPLVVFSNKKLEEIIKENSLEVISDPILIEKFILEIINQFPNLKEDYVINKTRCIKFVFGNLMKKTNGNIDVKIANEKIILLLEKNSV